MGPLSPLLTCLLVSLSYLPVQAVDSTLPATPHLRTLVLSDSSQNPSIQQTHSEFFQQAKDRGHALTFLLVDEPHPLFTHQHRLVYDNILLFAPETEDLLGSLDTNPITHFLQQGGNLFVAGASTGTSFLIEELAKRCGVVFSDPTTMSTDESTFSNINTNDDSSSGTRSSTAVNSKWPNIEDHWNVLYTGVTLSRASPSRKETVQHHQPHSHRESLSQSHYTSMLQSKQSTSSSGSVHDLMVGELNPYSKNEHSIVPGKDR